MQKYILGADIGNDCAMIRPIDDHGCAGEWQRYNAGIICKAEDVEAALAAKDARIQELQKEAAANHKILQQALDGCDRVDAESAAKDAEIERLRAEIAEWIAPSKKRHPHTARLQPIESAPREPGKRILLHFASTGVTCTGLWRGDFGWALTQPDGSLYWCRDSGFQPTHWMPLLDGSIDAYKEPQ